MTVDNVPTMGSTVLWRGRDCIVTTRYVNGLLIVSPKGNGNSPAQYYRTHEQDVKLK